jgi:hypothetical protein
LRRETRARSLERALGLRPRLETPFDAGFRLEIADFLV